MTRILKSLVELNPILQLKNQEELTFGGVGGRDGRNVRAMIGDALFGSGTVIAIPTNPLINPSFLDGLIHELQFGKVERHPRKAIKRFNKTANAMVRGLLSEVKRHG